MNVLLISSGVLMGFITATTAAVGALASAVMSLSEARKTSAQVERMRGEVKGTLDTAQHELTHNHGSSMKDSTHRAEGKIDGLIKSVDSVAAEQRAQGVRLHSLETGMGGIRDDIRQLRADDSQLRAEVANVRDKPPFLIVDD